MSNYPLKNTTAHPLVIVFEEYNAQTGEWLPCADDTVEIIEPGQTANLQLACLKRRAIFGGLPDVA